MSRCAAPPRRTHACVPQRAHAHNNNSAHTASSAGDATGHRSSGGAARVLCHFLRVHAAPLSLRGRRVVELGCGLGLAGLYAARTAAAVTLTDGDARALRLAIASHALNAPLLASAVVRFVPLAWSASAQLAPLFQDADASDAGDAAPAPPPAPPAADDAAAAQRPLPPLILGADLLYYADGISALMDTLDALLTAGGAGGLAVLAANPRHCGWAEALCEAAARLRLTAHSLPAEAVVPPEEMAHGWFPHTRLVRDVGTTHAHTTQRIAKRNAASHRSLTLALTRIATRAWLPASAPASRAAAGVARRRGVASACGRRWRAPRTACGC
jgi:predicted nicotinamide N-methyase